MISRNGLLSPLVPTLFIIVESSLTPQSPTDSSISIPGKIFVLCLLKLISFGKVILGQRDVPPQTRCPTSTFQKAEKYLKHLGNRFFFRLYAERIPKYHWIRVAYCTQHSFSLIVFSRMIRSKFGHDTHPSFHCFLHKGSRVYYYCQKLAERYSGYTRTCEIKVGTLQSIFR